MTAATVRMASSRTLAFPAAWALTFILLAMTFFAWRLVHRDLVPPPISSWHRPM